MSDSDPVRTFEGLGVKIRVYESDADRMPFVAADQAGWIPGSWASADEAMRAALTHNGLSTELAEDVELVKLPDCVDVPEHDWRPDPVSEVVIESGIKNVPVIGFEYEVVRQVFACRRCGRAREAVIERERDE